MPGYLDNLPRSDTTTIAPLQASPPPPTSTNQTTPQQPVTGGYLSTMPQVALPYTPTTPAKQQSKEKPMTPSEAFSRIGMGSEYGVPAIYGDQRDQEMQEGYNRGIHLGASDASFGALPLVEGTVKHVVDTARQAGPRNITNQLDVIRRIDAGQTVRPADDPLGYGSMSPEQRTKAKADLTTAQGQAPPPQAPTLGQSIAPFQQYNAETEKMIGPGASMVMEGVSMLPVTMMTAGLLNPFEAALLKGAKEAGPAAEIAARYAGRPLVRGVEGAGWGGAGSAGHDVSTGQTENLPQDVAHGAKSGFVVGSAAPYVADVTELGRRLFQYFGNKGFGWRSTVADEAGNVAKTPEGAPIKATQSQVQSATQKVADAAKIGEPTPPVPQPGETRPPAPAGEQLPPAPAQEQLPPAQAPEQLPIQPPSEQLPPSQPPPEQLPPSQPAPDTPPSQPAPDTVPPARSTPEQLPPTQSVPAGQGFSAAPWSTKALGREAPPPSPDARTNLQRTLDQPGPTLPGYQRTTAQQASGPGTLPGQNVGLVDLETALRTDPRYSKAFAARSHQQGAALDRTLSAPDRPEAAAEGTPYTAQPEQVGTHFRKELERREQAAQTAVEPQRATVEKTIQAAGGQTTPNEAGLTMQKAIGDVQAGRETTAQQGVAAATQARNQALAQTPVGKQPIPGGATVPEQYGAQAREQALPVHLAENERVHELYTAIDPEGKSGAYTTPFKQGANRFTQGITSSVELTPEETKILDVIHNWKDIEPLRTVEDLRSRINTAIAKETTAAGRTNTDVSRRLNEIKRVLDDGVEETLNATAASERAAVQAGQMSPEATMEARFRRNLGLPEKVGTAPDLQPMTAEQLEAAKIARAGAQQKARTFEEGAVGDILAPGEHRTGAQVPPEVTRAKGGFGVADAEVMQRLWNGKVTEAEALRQAQAAGITPDLLKAHAADDLRAFAVDKDGNFDPQKWRQWKRDHDAGLHVFPEVRKSFDNVERAQSTLAARQAELETVKAANPLKGIEQPSQIPGKYVTRGDTSEDMAKQFVKDSGGDAKALQAFDDSVVRRMRETKGLIKQDGTIDSTKLAEFRQDFDGALRQRPGLAKKLGDINTAQAEYDRVASEHVAQINTYKNGIAKNFLNGDDPLVAVGKVFSSNNPTAAAKALFEAVKDNPDAKEGLLNATAQYLSQKFRSARPASGDYDFVKSGQFRAWYENQREPLKAILGGQGVNNLDQVAGELRRASFVSETAKGSPTAQRLFAAQAKAAGGHSDSSGVATIIGAMEAGGEALGETLGPGAGKVAGVVVGTGVSKLISKFRQAGISTKDDLVAAMMLSPELTKSLVSRQPMSPIRINQISRALANYTAVVYGNRSTGQ